jgi:predicted acylesterase/phospholipase RssA
MSKEISETSCLTSYRSTRGLVHLYHSTRIWEACRATSAATTFFDHISIGKYGEEFVDGALGDNNPVSCLWNQAQDIWGADELQGKLRCIVSIGTGVPSLKPFLDDVLHIGHSLLAIATQTQRTAEKFRLDHSDLDNNGRYYRFNVDRGLENIGLEEAKKKNMIAAATNSYLKSQEVHKGLNSCAKSLSEVPR